MFHADPSVCHILRHQICLVGGGFEQARALNNSVHSIDTVMTVFIPVAGAVHVPASGVHCRAHLQGRSQQHQQAAHPAAADHQDFWCRAQRAAVQSRRCQVTCRDEYSMGRRWQRQRPIQCDFSSACAALALDPRPPSVPFGLATGHATLELIGRNASPSKSEVDKKVGRNNSNVLHQVLMAVGQSPSAPKLENVTSPRHVSNKPPVDNTGHYNGIASTLHEAPRYSGPVSRTLLLKQIVQQPAVVSATC